MPPKTSTVTKAPTQLPKPTDPLVDLRASMDSQMIAVADFGAPVLTEDFEIMDHLQDKYPQWLEEHSFVRDMPEDQIILTCDYETRANLVCIVPKDTAATVRVNVFRYMDESPYEKVDVVYYAETGDPFSLLADSTVSVDIADSAGNETIWYPNTADTDSLPENVNSNGLVLDFSPISEKDVYQSSLEQGWTTPDEDFRTYHYWRSDYGYLLELYYEPDENYDGSAVIYTFSGFDEYDGEYYNGTHYGTWLYENGNLHLKVSDMMWNEFEDVFPILTDPDGNDVVRIFCNEEDDGLPLFGENMQYDHLKPYATDAISFYAYSLTMGWRLPEFEELINTEWTSQLGYALDLNDDGVPGDNAGEVVLYDVSESGAYTKNYSGSWSYADGMLHLLLVPTGNGQFIDDNFPILMLDGELMICLNEYGSGLPYFYSDTMADVPIAPMG